MRLWISSKLLPRDLEVQGNVGVPCVVGVVFDAPPAGAPLVGSPITCGHCGAALTDPAAVRAIPGVGAGFRCAFCGTVLVLRDAPGGATEFQVAPPRNTDGLGPVVAGVIDISGSMAQGSLDAVRQSLRTTLEDLAANAPATGFTLVTFAHRVCLYGSEPSGLIHSLDDDTALANVPRIRAWAAGTGVRPAPVEASIQRWRDAIKDLVAGGPTALGPGLVAAAAIVGSGPARLILLTDGCANMGVGALNGPSTAGRRFYADFAAELEKAGTVVDLVAVAGEGKLELGALQVLPDVTGGELFYVDRAEVAGAFKSIGDAKIVARRAKLRIVLPAGLRATAVSGAGAAVVQNGQEISLGSIAAERELFFAVERTEGSEGADADAPIPVQVQLRYWDDRGAERLEVRSASFIPSDNPEAIKQAYDPGPYALMEVQRGGEEALAGGLEHAQARLQALRAKLTGMPSQGQAPHYAARVEEEIRNIEMELGKRNKASYADSSSASAYALSKRKSTFWKG